MERARMPGGNSCPTGLGAGYVEVGAFDRSTRRRVESFDRPMWSSYRTRVARCVRNFRAGMEIPLVCGRPTQAVGEKLARGGRAKSDRVPAGGEPDRLPAF